MTVKIDQSNSNPATCCTYHDDAKGMTAGSEAWDEFFGHYPCLFKEGQEVGKLNRNNFGQFEDGTTADITSGNTGDVMIAFPRRGLKISTNGNIVTISMTNNPNDPNFEYYAHTRGTTAKDVFYLGAYMGTQIMSTSGQKIRSLKNTNILIGGHFDAYRTFTQMNGTSNESGGSGYEQSGFFQLTYRQAMYVLKYKNIDSQTTIGRGYIKSSNTEAIKTGGTENWGMDCELIKQTNQSYMTDMEHHVKLFGIEDFWGNVQEWIDGVYLNETCNILTTTNNFNSTGSGYTTSGSSGLTDSTSGYVSKIQGTSANGFIAKEMNGSVTTHFCDKNSIASDACIAFGGYWKSVNQTGIFYICCYKSSNLNNSMTGTRLMYL